MPQNIIQVADTSNSKLSSSLNMSEIPGENNANSEANSISFNCKGNHNSKSIPTMDAEHCVVKNSASGVVDNLSIENPRSVTPETNPKLTLNSDLKNNEYNNDIEDENMDFSELENQTLEEETKDPKSLVKSDLKPSDDKSQCITMESKEENCGAENHSDVDEILDKLSKEDEQLSKKDGTGDKIYDEEGGEEGYVEGEEGEWEEGEYYEGEEGEYYEEGAEGEYEEGAGEGEYVEEGGTDGGKEESSAIETPKELSETMEKNVESSKKDVQEATEKEKAEEKNLEDAEDGLEDLEEGAEDEALDEAAENELLAVGDDESLDKPPDESQESVKDEAPKPAANPESLKTSTENEETLVKDKEKVEDTASKDKDTTEDQMDTEFEKEAMMEITDVKSEAEDPDTSSDKIKDASNDADMPNISATEKDKETSDDKEVQQGKTMEDELRKDDDSLMEDNELKPPELEMNEIEDKNNEVVLDDSDDDFDPISLLAVEHSTMDEVDEPMDSDFHKTMGIINDDESRSSSVNKSICKEQDEQSDVSEGSPSDSGNEEEESQDSIETRIESENDIDLVVKKKLDEILTKTVCQVDGIPEHFLLSTNRRKKLGHVKEGTVEEVMDDLISTVSSNAKKLDKESARAKLKEQKQSQDALENNQNWDDQDNQKGFKNCTECGSNKGLKYQVLFHGRTCFLCSDHCFQVFRSKQNLAPPPPGLAPRPTESCSVCKVEIKNGQGYFPLDTDGKSVCSEECIRMYQQMHGAKQTCAQCKKGIEGRTKCLTWETMEFCNEDCLGKYQQFLGSYCACCKQAVQRLSLGKYCVRFGSDIRQFCSGKCLEEFKKGLKVCTFCQKDLTGCTDGFLAPVGTKGLFKDFCSQQCLAQYETMNSAAGATPKTKKCSVCQKLAPVKAQVTFNNQEHTLCSDPCVAAFRYANKITNKICDTCHKFFKSESSPLQFEGASKRFCTKTCMNLFVLSHRKIVPCTWCKVKKYNFDMIERVDSNNHVQLFCSLNCLSLFRVSLNATSSRSVKCDHCRNNLPAQYHLTMSDASIRNFCTYQCVIQFQSQFTSVPTLTTVTPTIRNQNVPGAVKNVATAPAIAPAVNKPVALSSATPVISSVISLAPTNMGAVRPTQTNIAANVNSISTGVGTSFITQNAQLNYSPFMNKVQSVQAAPPAPAPPPTVQVIRELVVKPAPVKITKNKMISCKPSMQTKGVACKPHPCHKCTQTEEPEPPPPTYVPIPIPVPVFIPVPMHMYTRTVPCPTPFPLPIPVPVFIPTTKNNTEQILETLKEIRERTPDNPFEAELLMMAEMVASVDEPPPPSAPKDHNNIMPTLDHSDYDGLASVSLGGSSNENSMAPEYAEFTEPLLDLETALSLPQFDAPPIIEEEPHAFLSTLGDESSSDLTPREQRMRQRNNNSSKRRNPGRGKAKGRKRARLSEQGSEDSNEPYISGTETSFSEPNQRNSSIVGDRAHAPDANLCLKYMFGVNAWKHWVIQKNNQLERSSQSRRFKLFKTDLLQLSADDLNYSLCLFVKEVRKPNGEAYAPDSIYYLCLGIQMYIFENGRVDNIFTDAYYEKFTECLNEVVQKQEMAIMREGRYISRIEEEILWESKQLGAHSPHVLLNTLMYFNTKHFGLRNVDDHSNLSFSHIIKHYKKDEPTPTQGAKVLPSNPGKLAILKYYPPAKEIAKLRQQKREEVVYEQIENLTNVLRCPVKLYEFYLSKCPDSIRTRSDVFYLYPERSCVPDSPVWYSMQALGRDTLSKMLHRIRLVREINRPNLCD